jgi:hypothetical protein
MNAIRSCLVIWSVALYHSKEIELGQTKNIAIDECERTLEVVIDLIVIS